MASVPVLIRALILGHSLAMTCVTAPVVMQQWEGMDELLKEFQLQLLFSDLEMPFSG